MASVQDNAIIDYSAISNLISTLSAQEDLLSSISQASIVTLSDINNISNELTISSSHTCAMTLLGGTIEKAHKYTSPTILFPKSFISNPSVSLTLEISGSTEPDSLNYYITNLTTKSFSYVVYSKTAITYKVHILAIGQG